MRPKGMDDLAVFGAKQVKSAVAKEIEYSSVKEQCESK